MLLFAHDDTKNDQKYKVVVKCEWTLNQSDMSEFAKITRVSWTYLGVIFEQLNLSVFSVQYKCL